MSRPRLEGLVASNLVTKQGVVRKRARAYSSDARHGMVEAGVAGFLEVLERSTSAPEACPFYSTIDALPGVLADACCCLG